MVRSALGLTLMVTGCSPLIYAIAGGAPDGRERLETSAPVRGSTLGAHHDYHPFCAGGVDAADMAYDLVVPEDGHFEVQARAAYAAVIAVYDGETLLDCGAAPSPQSNLSLSVSLEAGRGYTVVMDGHDGAEGEYVLSVIARPDRERTPEEEETR